MQQSRFKILKAVGALGAYIKSTCRSDLFIALQIFFDQISAAETGTVNLAGRGSFCKLLT